MAGFVLSKLVTDPLDDRVRARLVGRYHDFQQHSYVSSGSEHSADDDCDSPSCDLSQLVHDFYENSADSTDLSPDRESDSESDRLDSDAGPPESIYQKVYAPTSNKVDSYKNLLTNHVSEAVETYSRFQSNESVFRRHVMAFLRELGHNAAVCKVKCNSSSGNLIAGNNEFIDAVQTNSSATWQVRYFVDLDFPAQFEIARPTIEYTRLLKSLPRVFVGKGEELKRIVRIMCEAAKRSLRSTELSVPPWRKIRFVENKWFGAYRRTVNPISEKSLTALVPDVSSDVKCRWVGFHFDEGIRITILSCCNK